MLGSPPRCLLTQQPLVPSQADPEVAALVRAFDREVALVRQRVLAILRASWLGLGEYHDAQVEPWVVRAASILEAGQTQTAALTDGYLATMESVVLTPASPVGVPAQVVSTEALRGVSTTELLGRPAKELYTRLAEAKPFPEALQSSTRRLASIADTNLQLAKTHTTSHVLGTKRHVVGYRRSLKGSQSCALCIVASTQRYRKQQLMPIHPGCDCGVIPIYAKADPGQVINPERLQGLDDKMSDRFGAFSEGARAVPGVTLEGSSDPLLYRNVLVTHDHREIGPVLGVRGQDFTRL